MDKPVILVTGCSSGIGREAVTHLRRAGALVVATARDPARIADLLAPGEVEGQTLDVADAAQRRAVVDDVLARHGRIDAMVNNAGFGATIAVEDTSLETMRSIFEVNVFGAHAMACLVLPTMRGAGRGRIINVASVAGHIPVPMLGAYCASKFALRALTQTMDNEVRRFGVRALLVEPGVIGTRFGTRSRAEAKAALGTDLAGVPSSNPYAPAYHRWAKRRDKGGGAHARVVARKIVKACMAQRPRFHNLAPASAHWAVAARRWLPESWTDWGMRRYLGR